jgi:periplasmic protein TonB
MNRPLVFSVLAACLALQAQAVAADGRGHEVHTYAIELDAQGGISKLAPHGVASDATAGELQRRIGSWIFAPAPSGAATTETFLRVVTARDASGDLDVVSATTGPAPVELTQPAYSARDQRAGLEGTVVLKLSVDEQGRVADVAVHDIAGDVTRAMSAAAVAAAKDWRFLPEKVGGQPVASTMLWPVCFLAATSESDSCDWRGPDAQRFSSKTVLTLEPAARVLSPLAFDPR